MIQIKWNSFNPCSSLGYSRFWRTGGFRSLLLHVSTRRDAFTYSFIVLDIKIFHDLFSYSVQTVCWTYNMNEMWFNTYKEAAAFNIYCSSATDESQTSLRSVPLTISDAENHSQDGQYISSRAARKHSSGCSFRGVDSCGILVYNHSVWIKIVP